MIEKSYELVTNNGVLGVIVPISLVSTTRMCNLRNYLFKRSENIYFASFADRPGLYLMEYIKINDTICQ